MLRKSGLQKNLCPQEIANVHETHQGGDKYEKVAAYGYEIWSNRVSDG